MAPADEARPPSPMDLDPDVPLDEVEARWNHEMEEQEARDAYDEELAQQMALVSDAERRQSAAEYRKWEEKVFQEEMQKGEGSEKKLRISLTASTCSRSSSSSSFSSSTALATSVLYLPTPPPGHALDLRVRLNQTSLAATCYRNRLRLQPWVGWRRTMSSRRCGAGISWSPG